MDKGPPPNVVHVTAWRVCGEIKPYELKDWKPPTEVQLKAAKRAMRSFARKFPQYAVMAAKGGRGRLSLYERGDKLSAMWAKLSSQSGSHVTIDDARAAVAYAAERRNEPFTLKPKRFVQYSSKSHALVRKEPRIFKDLDLSE